MRFSGLISLLLLSGCVINNIPTTTTPDSGASCGAQGGACCSGTACNSGLLCVQGLCQAPCGGAGQACCSGTACNSGLVCENATCGEPHPDGGNNNTDGGSSNTDGGTIDGGSSNTDGGSSNTDGGSSNTDGGMTDGGSSNMSCVIDTDCMLGNRCVDSVCAPGCADDSRCALSEYCDSASQLCTAGCRGNPYCSGLTCCDHVCTDTQTNAAANCGGCGAPACAPGENCCSGGCADTLTDPLNCGDCGNACDSTDTCVNGTCETAQGFYGLFQLTGRIAGDATTREVLKPFIFTTTNPLDLQSIVSRECHVVHWDALHAPSGLLSAGDVVFSGYAGGTFAASGVAPADIACRFQGGEYVCGYGMLMNGLPGANPMQSAFAAGTSSLGTSAISISAAGGTTFGSFSTTATPGTGLGVVEDLSALTYSANADTVINIACPGSNCGLGGFIVLVRASSNDVAHFDEPSTAGGSMVCFGGYGSAGGFIDLGPTVITLTQADIATMLGGDASVRTFETVVVTMSANDLTGIANTRQTDSAGRPISPYARTGSYGVSHQ